MLLTLFLSCDLRHKGTNNDLDDGSDGVEVAHDEHHLGGHALEYVEHAVVKLTN